MAPLSGIRVLDLSNVVAGPTTTMILADLGADVLKVERVDGGDDSRSMAPHRGEWGAYFVPLNRGKRSIAIDLKDPAGREAVLRLAATCDVFVENFRGGKAQELGLDEGAIRAVKPEIIYASLSAYGPHGPDYTKPGYDAILQARSGIVSVTGPNRETPIRAGVSILDIGAGVWLAVGVLAALLERKNSGQGQRVDASLLQTGVMLMCYHLLYQQFTGVNPVPQGTRHTSFAPYGAFPTSDGSILIGISNDRLFRRLCAALDRPEWTEDPRFSTNPNRIRNCMLLDSLITDLLGTQTSAHWLALLNASEIPCDAVQNAEQVLHDAQLAALHQFVDVKLTGEAPVAVPRLPIAFSATPTAVAGPPPRLGEHTREILSEAGYDDAGIDTLLQSGAAR